MTTCHAATIENNVIRVQLIDGNVNPHESLYVWTWDADAGVMPSPLTIPADVFLKSVTLPWEGDFTEPPGVTRTIAVPVEDGAHLTCVIIDAPDVPTLTLPETQAVSLSSPVSVSTSWDQYVEPFSAIVIVALGILSGLVALSRR